MDRATVYVSLARDVEHPAGMDPPADDAARCEQYTSSDEGEIRPAPTTDDRLAGKRPMIVEPSSVGAAPTGEAAGPVIVEPSSVGAAPTGVDF